MKKFLISLLILSFLGCSKEESGLVLFPETNEVSGKALKEIEIITAGNVNLAVVDTLLVVQKNEDKIINIFSTNSYKLLAEIGRTGDGPYEFKMPELLNPEKNDSTRIKVYDYIRRKLTTLDLKKLLNKDENIFEIQKIPTQINTFLPYFFYLDKNLLLATPEENTFFTIYNLKKDKTINIPYPITFNITQENERFYYKNIYRPALSYNTDKRIIATSPLMLPVIMLYDLKGNLFKTVNFDQQAFEKIKEKVNQHSKIFPNLTYFISEIEQLDDNIYCLNVNNPYEIEEKKRNNPKILVFDWELKPIKEIVLTDKRNIASFAYDKKHNRLYTYCPDEENYNLVVYDLN